MHRALKKKEERKTVVGKNIFLQTNINLNYDKSFSRLPLGSSKKKRERREKAPKSLYVENKNF